MEELFKGSKRLFEGLYIYDKWDWTQQYPVIRIDWTNIKHAAKEEMESDMSTFLQEMANREGITLKRPFASSRFGELIEQLHRKTRQQVVVLIDEYDVPILDAMGTPQVKDVREFLQDFYKRLKANDDHLKLIFLAGVSKFAKLSIFSTLNSPRDITLSEDFATICGYTQEELEHYFSEHIDCLAKHASVSRNEILDKIHKWYDGYSWDGKTRVYNPFSTLLLFTEKEFSNYWFASGTPAFLTEQLKLRDQIELVVEPVVATSNTFDSFDPDFIEDIPLLFQSGYLTVKDKASINERLQYTLDVPNLEVRQSLMEYLLSAYSRYPISQIAKLTQSMCNQLNARDAEGFARSVNIMLQNIPVILQIGNEKYYHSLFLSWMLTLGFHIEGEIMTGIGRIDAVWEQPDLIVVSELKYHAEKKMETLLDEVIAQIYDRRYYEKYLHKSNPILLMGLAFSGKEAGCRFEELKIQ
ncbi:MAG: ATPase AAA [Bacteroidales bacterium]